MPKPTMFVGSSSEVKRLIRGIDLNLKGEVTVRNWSSVAWPLSRSTLDGIERQLENADFAAFILAPDDIAVIRGNERYISRDNVLFEIGMAYVRLGRDRTFILAPDGPASDLRRASDLAGISVIGYESEGDARDAMSTPSSELLEAIQKLGRRDRDGSNGALERGDTTNIQVVADGALHVFRSRDTYVNELRQAILGGERVPAKVQFAQGDGGRHWLKLCRSPNYKYFNNAKAQLRENSQRLARRVKEYAGTTEIDLVSLGSGDGSKDDILLRALADELAADEYLYYYPVDISDILLVEAVRHVSQTLDRAKFRCKPILGDFTNLQSLNGIVAHRPNTNLFSLLGNALGSFDEIDILTSIDRAMQPGDLILLETNIGDPDDSMALLEGGTATQWDLSTLDALNIQRKDCVLHQDRHDDFSDVPDTRTLVSYAVLRDDPNTKYMLSAMHHYNFNQLKEYVQKELHVKMIDDFHANGVCFLLGQRLNESDRRRSKASSNGKP